MTIRGNRPEFLILDSVPDGLKSESINLSNLSQEDLEAYQRDPEAFMEWLDTVMGGGPQFHPFQNMDPLSMILTSRPVMGFKPERDNSAPYVEPKWHKDRAHSYAGHYEVMMNSRKEKRLAKRAKDKANRKRARHGKN